MERGGNPLSADPIDFSKPVNTKSFKYSGIDAPVMIQGSEYTIVRQLESGDSGVFEVRSETGEEYILKFARDMRLFFAFHTEHETLKEVYPERLKEWINETEQYVLLIKKVPGQIWVGKKSMANDQGLFSSIVVEAVKSLIQFHRSYRIHGDIKPRNLVIELPASGVQDVKVHLIDFQTSFRAIGDENRGVELVVGGTWGGTLELFSPEMKVQGGQPKYSGCYPRDWFALGLTLKEIYQGNSGVDLPNIDAKSSLELRLLDAMLIADPALRIKSLINLLPDARK